MGAGLEGNDQDEAALGRYSELNITSGSNFIKQFYPQYLTENVCFDFPRGAGGPEFNLEDRLRVKEAPMVSLSNYTRGLPRRVERQIRASWILVPALRNFNIRKTLLGSASIAYSSNARALDDTDAHGKELCAAAAELYEHLQKGAYETEDGKLRPIAGDIRW